MSGTRSKPPPAPIKTRATRSRAPALADEDALADDLDKLSLSKRTAVRAAAPAPARRATPAVRPLGRSTAANRQPPPATNTSGDASTPPSAAAAPPRRAAAPAKRGQTDKEEQRSPSERAKDAMQRLNGYIASLSGFARGGFRAVSLATSSPATTPTTAGGRGPSRAPSSASLRGAASAGSTKEKAELAAQEASRALGELRELVKEGTLVKKKVEVEKAAGSVVASLVEMEMYRQALHELSALRASILSWWTLSPPTPPPLSASPLAHAATLVVPLPPPSFFAPPSLEETLSSSPPRPALSEVVPLVLALQQYLLGCLFRLSPAELSPSERAEELSSLLRTGGGSPVHWRRLLEAHPEAVEGMKDVEKEALVKRMDAMMTSMFGTVTKACAGADGTVAPEALLTLRLHPLLFYTTLTSLSSERSPLLPSSPSQAPPQEKLDAFHDQHRKILLLYGRAAEARGVNESEIGERVKSAFEAVVQECRERSVRMAGKKWQELGEVVLHIARRAGDHAFVTLTSSLLGLSPSASASPSPTVPEQTAGALTLSASRDATTLLNALSIFESFSKSPLSPSPGFDAALDALRTLKSTLSVLTRLRTSSSPCLPHEAADKLDRTVDRARYVLVKHIRRGGTVRPEALLTPAGAAPPALSEVDRAAREALDRIAVHASRVLAEPAGEVVGEREEKARRDMATTAVDALLLLGYASMVVDLRETHLTSFAFLERCLPLVGLSSLVSSAACSPSTLDLSLHYSLRTLSSAFYNLGGTLFNSSLPDAAVRFCRLSCAVSSAAIARAREEGLLSEAGEEALEDAIARLTVEEKVGKDAKAEKEKRDAMRDLQKLAARRSELLALAAHAVGDKKSAYESYVSAVLSQPTSVISTLAADSARLPLSTLLTSHASLNKLIQRLTRLGVFDLLLPSTSIPINSAAASDDLPCAVRGFLLEAQLAALESSASPDRPEARKASFAILAGLEEVYGRDEFPLRRARVLVKKMQVLCAGGSASRDLQAEAAAREVEALCGSQNLASDAGLSPYIPQLLSLSHLFLALHVHSSAPPSPLASPAAAVEASETVASEARQALQILRTAFDDHLPASPSAPAPLHKSPAQARAVAFQSPAKDSPPRPSAVAAPPPTTRTRRTVARAAPSAATRSAPARTPLASSTRRTTRAAPAIVEQVTPPRRRRGEVRLEGEQEQEDKPAPIYRTPVKQVGKDEKKLDASFDGVESVYGLLETMSHLLGTLGHVLLRITYLKFLRRLSSKLPTPTTSADAFVLASSRLGHEFLRLGKTARAGFVFAQADGRVTQAAKPGADVSKQTRVEYWLLYGEYLAMLGNHDRAALAYESALKLAAELDKHDLAPATTAAKIVERTLLLRRTALAATVGSVLLQRKGELSRSLAPAMQAMRLGTRALNNISRLAPAPPKASPSPAGRAFDAPPIDHVTGLADAAPINQRKSTVLPGGAHAGLSWQLAEALLDATLRVASLHCMRGTPKSADFYATQALDLAEDLGSTRLMARALALRADVRLHWEKFEEGDGDLDAVERLVGSIPCPEATELHRLRADLHLRASMHAEAYQLYLNAQKSLETFVSAATEREAGSSPVKQATPAKHLSPVQTRGYFTHPWPSPTSARTAAPLDLIFPTIQAYLLLHLLNKSSKPTEIQQLLRRLAKVASLEEDKADELKLRAALQIQDFLARCSSDPVLGMLPDSVLSMPVLGIAASGSAVAKVGTPRTGPTVVNSLKEIEGLLARALSFSTSRSQPAKLRELALLSATTRTLQASVGKSTRRSTTGVAHTLDLATAVTLRREMLDAVEHKLADGARHDDLDWPSITLPPSSHAHEPSHLQALRERYRLESAEPALTDSSMSSALPESWSAISIHLTPEHDSLILVRHRRASEPLLFKLPLDRLARREGEDDAFTYEVAAAELKEIIELSNQGTQSAKHVDGKEERAAWWQARKELDQRLQALLQQMEDAWLGAFKSIFYDARKAAIEDFAGFKSRLERILKRSMVRAAGDKKTARFKLDDAVVECLAALPSTSREEDLEDLFYYAAESFHFSGVPLAHDETDVDQVVVDLREALEELHGTKSAPKRIVDPDEHTFLILDKAVQAFPWESLPCLRGRSVSRLPSLAFLRDRLDLAVSRSSSPEQSQDLVVDPAKASFVLNPGGDLKNTQKTFEPWLDERKDGGWSGVVARAPLEEEVKTALTQKELFLYFGHGGAEQYIRSQTIRHLPRCAVTMLWGCSSGMLKEQGDFDPVGTPYHYMVAGCPALVANLWDVTDKDIDKLAFAVLRKTGVAPPESGELKTPPLSLTAAVASSRDVCNLRYLNGAAVVVYGIPVWFSSSSP
ncbi:separin protein [Rhodosporidiobolus nylandii]